MHSSKTCFKCNTEKPLTLFYKHREMLDGHLNKCIECAKIDVAKHRKGNLERIRQYDRERGKLENRKLQSAKNSKALKERITNYSSLHCKITRMVKSGAIVKQPCCMCGSVMVHAHLDEYKEPIEIMWLCAVHHKARHFYLKYIEQEIC